jgi:hypothetical protein
VALNCLVVPPSDCLAMPSPDYLVAPDCLADPCRTVLLPTSDCLAVTVCLHVDIRSFGFGFEHGPKKYRLGLVEFEGGGCTGASLIIILIIGLVKNYVSILYGFSIMVVDIFFL